MWAGGRVGEDGGARDAAVRKFRSDPKRAVDEQRARLQSIELRIQVIAPSEPRQAVGKQVLLQPCLLEPNRGGSREVAHALHVPHETTWRAAVCGESEHEQACAGPPNERSE